MLWVPRLTCDRAEILRDIVDELAVGRQVENLLVEDPVVPDLRADQDRARARSRAASPSADRDRRPPGTRPVEARTYSSAAFGTIAALVHAPVIAELGQRAVDPGAVAGAWRVPNPVSRLELTLPKPCTSATAQVHGPLSTEALKPNWVRSSVADCSASGTSMAVRLWSTEKPTLTPGRDPRAEARRRRPRSGAGRRRNRPARRSWPKSRRPRPRSGTAVRRSPPRRRRRPDCSATRARSRIVAWLPSRSRKLLPRLVTVAPADRSELISRSASELGRRRGLGGRRRSRRGAGRLGVRRRRRRHGGQHQAEDDGDGPCKPAAGAPSPLLAKAAMSST